MKVTCVRSGHDLDDVARQQGTRAGRAVQDRRARECPLQRASVSPPPSARVSPSHGSTAGSGRVA